MNEEQIEKGYNEIIGQLEQRLVDKENALRQAEYAFKEIISQCLARADFKTPDELEEKLKADEIYRLATKGLKSCEQPVQIN